MKTLRKIVGTLAAAACVAPAALFAQFIYPVSGTVPSGGQFGACRDGCSRLHAGLDISGPTGTFVGAAYEGTVSFSGISCGLSCGYGRLVIVNHPSGYQTYYAHNDSNLVSSGNSVSQNQNISKRGNTGSSTGPHVHFEIRRDGTPLLVPGSPGDSISRNSQIPKMYGGLGENPPYMFDNGKEGWDNGSGISDVKYANNETWPGVIHFDQTADGGWVRGPISNFKGGRPEAVNVRFYPQGGTSANHSMRARWITTTDGNWDNAKSSPRVQFNAQNEWAVLNLDINGPDWNNETIKRMRLQFDNVNKGTKWRIDRIVVQDVPRYWFDSNKEGWFSGGGLGDLTWVSSAEGSDGVIRADQHDNWGWVTSPEISFRGGRNDRVTVRLHPKFTSSNIHDAEIRWKSAAEDFYSADKASPRITFNAQNEWVVLTFDVGSNPKWEGKRIKRIRLRLDSVNHNARWLISNIRITQETDAR